MTDSLLEVIKNMPLTWTCLDCGREFDNSPDSEHPFALRTKIEDGKRVVVGQLCKRCCGQDE